MACFCAPKRRMAEPVVVDCDKHIVVEPPTSPKLQQVQTFRQDCRTFVDRLELDFFRRTATFRSFCPKRHRIHCVWDFSYGRDLPPAARSRFIRPDNAYILVTFAKPHSEQAFWIPYHRSRVDRQNPRYVLNKVGSLQLFQNRLCSVVNYSNLPFSDRVCISCLMDSYR